MVIETLEKVAAAAVASLLLLAFVLVGLSAVVVALLRGFKEGCNNVKALRYRVSNETVVTLTNGREDLACTRFINPYRRRGINCRYYEVLSGKSGCARQRGWVGAMGDGMLQLSTPKNVYTRWRRRGQ